MGKQKKRKLRQHRNAVGPYATEESQDVLMDTNDDHSVMPSNGEAVKKSTETHSAADEKATPADNAETEGEIASRHIYKRQAVEWRKMKAEVAQLKRQRQKLRKKNVVQREERKKLGRLIKTKILGLRQKHDAELKSLGLSKSTHDSLPEEAMCVD